MWKFCQVMPQNKRIKTLDKTNKVSYRLLLPPMLPVRDYIDGISHVINFTLPEEPEDYIVLVELVVQARVSISSLVKTIRFYCPI